LKVKCYYAYNATNTLSFIAAHANNEPYAEPAGGGLEVVIRMASGRVPPRCLGFSLSVAEQNNWHM
jgi:hypothetical protein